MKSIFGHGQLRLYLLRVLRDGPRSGYDVIRLLEDNFLGLYAPSTGTIYPRLHRLATEGLVDREQSGGRQIYTLTEAGRAELERRKDELDALEDQISTRQKELARTVQEQTDITVEQVRDELDRAAGQLRRGQRQGIASEVGGAIADVRQNLRQFVRKRRFQQLRHRQGEHVEVQRKAREELDNELARFDQTVRELAGSTHPTAAQLGVCTAIITDALERIGRVLRA